MNQKYEMDQTGTTDSPDLQQALRALASAQRASYYDSAADGRASASYYRDTDLNAEPAALCRALHTLTSQNTRSVSYDQARHQYLYTSVDLQPNGKLRSIYTNQEFRPETILREDFAIEAALLAKARERVTSRGNFAESDLQEEFALLKAAATFNAEHVVPQSWFGQRLPMKSDLHHLFTCETDCNSFRGNTPYFAFNPLSRTVRPGCGRLEENRFEPSHGHGQAARATLYFLLRYPGEINRTTREYTPDRLPMLLQWHQADPVTIFEKHRNATIFRVQKNRNPLIDHPELASRIDFTQGLGRP